MLFLALVLAEFSIFYLVPVNSEYQVTKGEIEVYASETKILSFDTQEKSDPNLHGFYEVSNGDAISAIILDSGSFINWENHRNATFVFSKEQTTFEEVNLNLERDKNYYFIFDNTFSSLNKTVNVDLAIAFMPAILGIPTAYLVRFAPIIPLAIAVFVNLQFVKKEDKKNIFPRELLYFLLMLVLVFAFITSLSPPASISEVFTRLDVVIGSTIAIVSVFVSVVALRISAESKESAEKMTKVQLVYDDRKRALDKLVSIMKSERYDELLQRYNEFKSSTDWLYLPEKIKKETIQKVNELIKFAYEKNPEPEPYSEDELDALIEEQQEMEQEDFERMDPYDQYILLLNGEMSRTKYAIETIIKGYLDELSKD